MPDPELSETARLHAEGAGPTPDSGPQEGPSISESLGSVFGSPSRSEHRSGDDEQSDPDSTPVFSSVVEKRKKVSRGKDMKVLMGLARRETTDVPSSRSGPDGPDQNDGAQVHGRWGFQEPKARLSQATKKTPEGWT